MGSFKLIRSLALPAAALLLSFLTGCNLQTCTFWSLNSSATLPRSAVPCLTEDVAQEDVMLALSRKDSPEPGIMGMKSHPSRLMVYHHSKPIVPFYVRHRFWLLYPQAVSRPVLQQGETASVLMVLHTCEQVAFYDTATRKPLQYRRQSCLEPWLWTRGVEAWPESWDAVHERQRTWVEALFASDGVGPVNNAVLAADAPYHYRKAWVALFGLVGGGQANGRRYFQFLWFPISLGETRTP